MLPVPHLEMIECAWITIKSGGHCLYGFLLFVAGDHFFPKYLSDEGLADLEGWTGKRCELFILQSPSAQWIDYSRTSDTLWWTLFGASANKPPEPKVNLLPSRISLHFLSTPTLFSRDTEAAHLEHSGSHQLRDVERQISLKGIQFSQKDAMPSLRQESAPANSLSAGASYWEEVLKINKAAKANALNERYAPNDVDNDTLVHIEDDTYSLAEIFSPCMNHFQHAQEIQTILHKYNLDPTDHPCLIFFKDINDRDAWFVDLKDLVNLEVPILRSELKSWFASKEFSALLAEARNA